MLVSKRWYDHHARYTEHLNGYIQFIYKVVTNPHDCTTEWFEHNPAWGQVSIWGMKYLWVFGKFICDYNNVCPGVVKGPATNICRKIMTIGVYSTYLNNPLPQLLKDKNAVPSRRVSTHWLGLFHFSFGMLRWSRGSVLAFGTQVRGSKPGRSHRIFKGKNRQQRTADSNETTVGNVKPIFSYPIGTIIWQH
jgi:hypothetical protein